MFSHTALPRTLRGWAIAALLAVLPSAASAAVMTKTYDIEATFIAGPITTLKQSFTLTFDPSGDLFTSSVADYSTDTASPAFNVPIGSYNYVYHSLHGMGLVVGGTSSTIIATALGTDDFAVRFYVDLDGDITVYATGFKPSIEYTLASDPSTGYITDDIRITVSTPGGSGAVPEPATWITLITGFGLIGGAMRRGRRTAFRSA